MRIQITAGGIHGVNGEEIPLGTEFDVDDEPTGWAGRYVVVSDSKGKTAVTGKKPPADPKRVELEEHTVEELKKIADDEKVDLTGVTAKGDIISAILQARGE